VLAMFQQASEKKGEKIRHANRGNRISLLNDAEAPLSKRVGRVYLAELYSNQGRYAEAEPLYKRALMIYEKALGPEHPDVAYGLNNLAALYDDGGKYAEVEPLYKRSLVIREKMLGPEHPLVTATLANLATLYQEQGRFKQADLFLVWMKKLVPITALSNSSLPSARR